MIVNFYATLRSIVGARQVEFPLPPGGTLHQLIAEIIRQYPALRAEMLDSQGNLHGHIHIFVNGRDSTLLADTLGTILGPSDTIAIFPPVGGG